MEFDGEIKAGFFVRIRTGEKGKEAINKFYMIGVK